MRPLELRLRNFRSYFGSEAVFDFRHRSLVGMVGPIGSGKSSLLDAVAFALYGRTPSEGQATSRLIHQRADHGGVSSAFEVDGEIWEAVRVLRRKGQSQHALYRYESDTAERRTGREGHPGAPGQRPDQGAPRARLRHLRRSVLLAQGRFAEFLKGAPADRDRVLKGVFGHDRIDQMREVAKARSVVARPRGAAIDGRLAQVDVLEAKVADRVAELEDIEARLEALAKAEPTVVDLELRISAARVRGREGRGQAARSWLRSASAWRPPPWSPSSRSVSARSREDGASSPSRWTRPTPRGRTPDGLLDEMEAAGEQE